MLNLGIIGTNWITKQFIEAAEASKEYRLALVYSRKLETAHSFAADFSCEGVTDSLEDFYKAKDIDVVYIASPNSLHFEQAKASLEAGKHVIVEKPAVSTLAEWQHLLAVASENDRFIFEAARNIHEDSFKKVSALLSDCGDDVIGANISFMKYSSRYDAVLAGEEPNIFSLDFSGGALMDLGVYVLYASVAWFGKPESVHYFARKIRTGVDGIGTMVLRYENFDVNMMTGKIGNSFLPTDIYTPTQTISLNAINSIDDISVIDQKGNVEKVPCTSLENPMIEEAVDFATVINNPTSEESKENYSNWCEVALTVHDIMETLRKQEGIYFKADKK